MLAVDVDYMGGVGAMQSPSMAEATSPRGKMIRKARRMVAETNVQINLTAGVGHSAGVKILWPLKCQSFFQGKCGFDILPNISTWFETMAMFELCCEAAYPNDLCLQISAQLFEDYNLTHRAAPDDDFCEELDDLDKTHAVQHRRKLQTNSTQTSSSQLQLEHGSITILAKRLLSSFIEKMKAAPYPLTSSFMGGSLVSLGLASAVVAPAAAMFQLEVTTTILATATSTIAVHVQGCKETAKRVIEAAALGGGTAVFIGAIVTGNPALASTAAAGVSKIAGASLGAQAGATVASQGLGALTAGAVKVAAVNGATSGAAGQAFKEAVCENPSDASIQCEVAALAVGSKVPKRTSLLESTPLTAFDALKPRLSKVKPAQEDLNELKTSLLEAAASAGFNVTQQCNANSCPPFLYEERTDNCWSWKNLGKPCKCWYGPFAQLWWLHHVWGSDWHGSLRIHNLLANSQDALDEYKKRSGDYFPYDAFLSSLDFAPTQHQKGIFFVKLVQIMHKLTDGYIWQASAGLKDICRDDGVNTGRTYGQDYVSGYVPWEVHGAVSNTLGPYGLEQIYLSSQFFDRMSNDGDDQKEENIETFWGLLGLLAYQGPVDYTMAN